MYLFKIDDNVWKRFLKTVQSLYNTPRYNIDLDIKQVVNSGTSSKMRYRYFVPTAHPGTFEIAPEDENV